MGAPEPLQKLSVPEAVQRNVEAQQKLMRELQAKVDAQAPPTAPAAAPPLSRREKAAIEWVLSNVPCFEGELPPSWVAKVGEQFRGMNLVGPELDTVMRAVTANGYHFPPGPGVDPAPRVQMDVPGRTMSPQEVVDEKSRQHAWANISGDREKAQEIAKAVDSVVESQKVGYVRVGSPTSAWGSPLEPEADNVRNVDGSRPVRPDPEALRGEFGRPAVEMDPEMD